MMQNFNEMMDTVYSLYFFVGLLRYTACETPSLQESVADAKVSTGMTPKTGK